MLLSLRKNGLTSLFKEVRVFKVSFEACAEVRWRASLERTTSWDRKRRCDPMRAMMALALSRCMP